MNNHSIRSFVLACLLATVLTACGGSEPPPTPPPPAVEYLAVEPQEVALRFEFVARTRAREDATIMAQISGTIVERGFEEGQSVEEGDLLFQIDPRPYQAALDVAQAELSQASTALDVAERNLARGVDLEPDGFISAAEMDELRGTRDAAFSSKQSAEAALEQARINLEYTDVRAPFSGRTGRVEVSTGDLVSPGSSTLVTIVQSDPMLVDFEVSERVLAGAMTENQKRAAEDLEPLGYTPHLQLVTGDSYPHVGKINYANNRINASTGTVTVTAEFPNPDGSLLPGQFTRVFIERSDVRGLLVIPQASVLEDMQGRYVYVIDDENLVQRRNVALGQRQDIDWVVESGLEEGNRVIVNGIQKVRPGMAVSASSVATTPYEETNTGNQAE
ncbi:MAG: efflux RND transporter periplasmic adaptor subunit [Woeseiaceae bacterium]